VKVSERAAGACATCIKFNKLGISPTALLKIKNAVISKYQLTDTCKGYKARPLEGKTQTCKQKLTN
jgi:hypothetical protein